MKKYNVCRFTHGAIYSMTFIAISPHEALMISWNKFNPENKITKDKANGFWHKNGTFIPCISVLSYSHHFVVIFEGPRPFNAIKRFFNYVLDYWRDRE